MDEVTEVAIYGHEMALIVVNTASELYRCGYESAVHDMMRLGLNRAVDALRFQARWGSGKPEWRAGYCDAILTGVQARMDDLGWLAHETLEWPAEILKRIEDERA